MYPSRLIPILLVFVALVSVGATAQELEIAVSPSPVGAGGRAAGMADAFIAVADDATAISWNPAGLVQLERPEISIVGSFNGIREHMRADHRPGFDSSHSDSNYDLNFASVVYPLPFLVGGRNAAVSVAYQRKYDFSRSFTTRDTTPIGSAVGVFSRKSEMRFRQEGGIGAISLAYAMELTHRVSLGVSVNLWHNSFLGQNEWEHDWDVRRNSLWGLRTLTEAYSVSEEYRDFRGENITLGLLWTPTDRLSLGLRYDSAFTGEVDYKRTGTYGAAWLPGLGGFSVNFPLRPYEPAAQIPMFVREEKRQLRFPETYALGAAYRFSDRFMMSMDITRTDWNDYYVEDEAGRQSSLVDASRRDLDFGVVDFDPTYTVRLGAEYTFIPRNPPEELPLLWTLRGGVFYDEEPASGRSNKASWFWENTTLGTPSGKPDQFYGVAVGCGLLAWHRVNVDLAYQFRWGNDVNHDFLRGVSGFHENVRQHRVLLSTVVYF